MQSSVLCIQPKLDAVQQNELSLEFARNLLSHGVNFPIV